MSNQGKPVDPEPDDDAVSCDEDRDEFLEIDVNGRLPNGRPAKTRQITRATRRKIVLQIRPIIQAQTDDLDEMDVAVARLEEIRDNREPHLRAESREIESHLRAVDVCIRRREVAIAHRLILREYFDIVASADPSARARHAAVLVKITPRALGLAESESPGRNRPSAEGLG